MELFLERGYDQTTVQDIAAHAGLTERTFFRYFADKREVLFSGAETLEKSIVERIENAEKEASALDAVIAAFEAAAGDLEAHRDIRFVRARWSLVTEHADIQERELIKLASLAAAVRKALHARGVVEPEAGLVAEVGIAAFKIGFERWLAEKKPRDFAAHIRAAKDVLRAIAQQESKRPSESSPARRAARKRS
jgi:AcrR family transcriptional regulator